MKLIKNIYVDEYFAQIKCQDVPKKIVGLIFLINYQISILIYLRT